MALTAALTVVSLPAMAAQATKPAPASSAAPQAANPAQGPASTSQARKAALSPPKSSQFRPSGPITITADRAKLVAGGYAVYSGNVKVSSNTLNMQGDRLKLKQSTNRQYVATVTGTPAQLSHASSGPDDPPVTAHADTLIYNSDSQTIILDGHAQLTRGDNSINGQHISYNLAVHQVQAGGGNGGQVKMVIQPPPPTHHKPKKHATPPTRPNSKPPAAPTSASTPASPATTQGAQQ